jgi:ketosteroid isomerase-like protein
MALLSLLVAGRPVGAQSLPTDPAHESRRNQKQEFLSVTYQEIKEVLQEWRDLVARGDTQALAKAVTETVFFSPAEGWRASGREQVVDSAGRWLTAMRNYSLTPEEFDASGSMAYVLAHVRYERTGTAGGGSEFVIADCFMVFYREGRHWRMRSYFERFQESRPD